MRKLQLEKYFPFLIPALVILLGAALRLVCLGTMPGGMHQDESFVAWNAFAILHEGMDSAGHVFPVYMADWGDGHSALYVWLTLPFILMNGGHVEPFLSRLPQAIVGILTLAAVYGIVRRTVGEERDGKYPEQTAIWTTFLLAVCPWHVMMSRWGLDANLAPGFLMFGLYFFVRALDKECEKFLLLSALFYGLSLYAYAVIWPVVPFILLLQTGYGLFHRKLRIDRWSLLASLLLFVMALPLILFVLVNSGVIDQIELPFMTIPVMGGYRGGEIAFGIREMWSNLRTALSLLWNQNTGAPYDILLPWGLFYDIGRVFMIIGAVVLFIKVLKGVWRRQYTAETFLFIQLMGGGLICLLVTAVLHQINALYIPLVICEGYGVVSILKFLEKYGKLLTKAADAVIFAVYVICLVGFQKDYYTDYHELVDAYFGAGIEECVDYALEICERTGIKTITVEKGAQWPRLLLFTETLPSEYLASVVYDEAPAPASFVKDDILIKTRIDYKNINDESVYIIYFNDKDKFSEDFKLTKFYDWYVAEPR